MVVQQAMAARLPVVASAVGGIPDLVINGHSALLFPAGNVEVLATRLDEALSNPAHAVRIADAAQRIAIESFRAEVVADNTVRAYRSVIASA